MYSKPYFIQILLLRTVANAADLSDQALSTTMHAMRTYIYTALKGAPGALVFGRDMFLDIPLIADWQTIQLHRKTIVNKRLRKATREEDPMIIYRIKRW